MSALHEPAPRELARVAAGLVADFWETYADLPAAVTSTREERARFEVPLPRSGIGSQEALQRIARDVLPRSTGRGHPRAYAFVDGSALEVSVLADLLVDALNSNLASANGALTWVEEAAWRWTAEFVGYPAGCGVFTSGGTVANLSALAIARERAVPGAREHGVAPGTVAVYCSAEAHHSVDRACDLLGLGRSAVRRLAVDDALRLRPDALRAALAADRDAGVTPLAVWASAGTTNTGAVDPLDAIADIAANHAVWLHIDGAWGAPAAAAPTTAALFTGMARADSLSVDPHKWLYVPKDCGCLLVRDPDVLEQTFAEDAAYLENVGEGPLWGPWSLFRGIEYSRAARGTKLWAAFLAHGADAFRDAIERDLANARAVADAVRSAPDLELLDEPQLSAVVFRHVPPGLHGAALEAHNRALLDAMQRDGRCFCSGTTVRGAFAIRPCFTSHRTTRADALCVVEVARELGAALA